MSKNKLSEKDYPIKGYFHFDYPIHISNVESYIQNQEKIADHSFFPLVAYEQKFEKYVKNIMDYTDGRPYEIKSRPIKYAGHLDGYIYKYYAKQLNYAYNEWARDHGIDNSSVAYRTNKIGKSNIDFAAEVINYIASNNEAFILVSDFKDFFGSFDHYLLKERMYEVLSIDYLPLDWFNIYKSVTKYGFIEKTAVEKYFGNEEFLRQQGHKKFTSKQKRFADFRKIHKIKSNEHIGKGVPQGVPISAVMANVYTINFDQEVNALVEKNQGLYRRYSDDFIIVIPNSVKGIEDTEIQFKNIIEKVKLLAIDNKLEIAGNKTHTYKKINNEIYEIYKKPIPESSSIDYLGFVYDGTNVSIRQRSIERFYRRMRKTVRVMERKRIINNRNINKPKMKKLPHRNRIYGLFTDRGFKGMESNRSNFIEYVKRSQKIFDRVSPNTNNLMLEQIKNRKKKLENILGNKIHIRQEDN